MLTEAQLKLLEEVAPWWAKRIRKNNLKSTRMYSLSNPDSCVVGEAHQAKKLPEDERYWYSWKNPGYCKSCDNHGVRMHTSAAKAPDYDFLTNRHYMRTPRFDSQVRRFLTHFVKVHAKKGKEV